MADITSFTQGNVNPSEKVNWRGDQVSVTQGGQSIYESSSVMLAPLGARVVVGDRVFRYALAGGDIGAGDLTEVSTSVTAASHVQVCGSDATKGDKTLVITAETTAPKDIFAEGYVTVHSGTAANMGYTYRIKSHAAIASAGTGTAYLYDEIAHTIASADSLTILANVYKNILECTAAGDLCLGASPIAVTSGDYFWLQTYGPAGIKCAAATEGEPMMPDATGQAAKLTYAATADGLQTIGVAMQAVSNSTNGLVFLTISP